MESNTKIFGLIMVIEAINAIETVDGFSYKGLKGKLFNDLEKLIRQHSISTSYFPVEEAKPIA